MSVIANAAQTQKDLESSLAVSEIEVAVLPMANECKTANIELFICTLRTLAAASMLRVPSTVSLSCIAQESANAGNLLARWYTTSHPVIPAHPQTTTWM